MTPPDSGEREVFQRYLALRMDAQNAATETAQDEILAEMDGVWRELNDTERAKVRHMVLHGSRDSVLVPLPLARRILAALECKPTLNTATMADLASELRAAVERKP